MLILGDCLEEMPKLEENSVDTIITDPPYGLDFMGKNWDHGVPGVAFWKAALRVAKPGAMLFAFGGTRTVHRLTCAIEDAGWIIRDRMAWLYGSGFPKSHNISKGIDKAAIITCPHCDGTGTLAPFAETFESWHRKTKDYGGTREEWERLSESEAETNCPRCKGKGEIRGAEREVMSSELHRTKSCVGGIMNTVEKDRYNIITAPATPAAIEWDGYGTALKPAQEIIIVAMAPLEGTFAENALKWGVAGLWIDGGRVEGEAWKAHDATGLAKVKFFTDGEADVIHKEPHPKGRWPANILHDGSEEVNAVFPQTGNSARPNSKGKPYDSILDANVYGKYNPIGHDSMHNDSGSAARFFYTAKASKAERNAGLEGMEQKRKSIHVRQSAGRQLHGDVESLPTANHHPTVKPLALMRYLCRLSRTPSGGVVLDPFMGSGTTGVAARMEGREFIGIELDADYFAIAEKRIAAAQPALVGM